MTLALMQVGLAAKDMLAREPDLTLYRQLSCFTLQVFHKDLMSIFIILKKIVEWLLWLSSQKVVEWKQSLTKGVNMYKPGQHLLDAEADEVKTLKDIRDIFKT